MNRVYEIQILLGEAWTLYAKTLVEDYAKFIVRALLSDGKVVRVNVIESFTLVGVTLDPNT